MSASTRLERFAGGKHHFDYHWQVHLPDGSWAEKFGYELYRIVSVSNRHLDLATYPWDSHEYWAMQGWTAFYTSEPLLCHREGNYGLFMPQGGGKPLTVRASG